MADGNDFLDYLPLYPEEDEATVRARWNGWANEGLSPEDARYVDTREGSMFQVLTEPGVREAARIYDLMGSEVPAAASPLWAWGEYLDDHAEVQDLERLEATPATGEVTFTGEPGTLIAAGTEVGVEPPDPDAEAPEFATTAGGTVPEPLDSPEPAATPGADGTLPDGSRFYAVTALDAEGGETAYVETTGEVEAVVAAGGGTGSVELTWPAIAGASGYRVYLQDTGIYELLAEVTDPTYTDTGDDVPDDDVEIPAENTTGGRLTLPVTAIEPGSAGRVAAGAIEAVLTPGLPVDVTNAEPTVGGTEPEDDEALRERLLAEYVGGAGGNALYYLRIARAYPGVGGATVIPLANGPGTVLVIIYGQDGEPASPETIDGLQALLDPVPQMGSGEALIGAHVTVETAAALTIDVELPVEFEEGFSLDGAGGTIATRADILEAVGAYVEQVEPGGEVVRSKVSSAVVSVTGLHDAGEVLLNSNPDNVAVPSDPAQVPVLGEVTLTEEDV